MLEHLRCGRFCEKSMALAVTSTSTHLCCLPESPRPMIRFPQHARPRTACRLTVAWPNLRSIRIRTQGESNDHSPHSVRGASTVSSLVHGRMHHFYAVHRCRHDLNYRPEIPDADPDSQAAWDCYPGVGADSVSTAHSLRRTGTSGQSSHAYQASRGAIAVHFLCADDWHAIDRLGYVVSSVPPGDTFR